ncbi:MAG: protein translocase subunit SecF [Candidatus Limiplasma sp.]|nr:protein translocase subunit SecF [Candidatus Limiplasma sp.]
MKVKNHSRICLIVSGSIMVLALLLSLFGLGINMGLDFVGGLSIRYDMGQAFDQADVAAALDAQGIAGYSVAHSGDQGQILQVRIPELATQDDIQNLQSSLEATLLAKYPQLNTATATANYVGPIAGAALVRNAIFSVLLATVLMLAYIAFRFDLYSGIAAVAGLVHDVLIMLSFMVLLRSVVQMNSSFIAAMLTIVGYSINNTIVIFDRIRENNAKPGYHGLKREEIVNLSVGQSLGRTINTTLTTLITIVTLYIMGVDAIREFSLPIIVGIVSGVYSANMINGYVWAWLEERRRGRKGSLKQPSLKAKKA